MERETPMDEEPPEEWEPDDIEALLPEMAEAGGWLAAVEEAADELCDGALRWANKPVGRPHWKFLTLTLTADEHVALNKLAVSEEREKYEMAELILRRELRRRGLL